ALSLVCLGGIVPFLGRLGAPPRSVVFAQSRSTVEAYDYVELTAKVASPRAANPFTDAAIEATFTASGGRSEWQGAGLSDARDGSLYRVRFMPPAPGDYTYAVRYRQGWYSTSASGTVHVTAAGRRGPVRIDPEHRWHFIWEGTGEHYFFNGTTAYWLAGWEDDR